MFNSKYITMLNLKGYSILLLIIVSLAIALSIFIAIWFRGLIEDYTKFEEIRVSSSTISLVENYWIIELQVMNVGSRLAVIDTIFINDMPVEKYGDSIKELTINGSSFNYETGYPLDIGQKVIIRLKLIRETFNSGATIQIRIRTKRGHEYFRDIKLP